jgi:hypothetical protein
VDVALHADRDGQARGPGRRGARTQHGEGNRKRPLESSLAEALAVLYSGDGCMHHLGFVASLPSFFGWAGYAFASAAHRPRPLAGSPCLVPPLLSPRVSSAPSSAPFPEAEWPLLVFCDGG